DVPGRPRRHRTAPELPEGALKRSNTRPHRRNHICESLAPRVVEMPGQLNTKIEAVEEPLHLHRIRHPRGIAEGDLLAADGHKPPRDLAHPLPRHLTLAGATEDHGDHALAAQALSPRARDDPLQPGEGLLDRAVHVLAVVGL